MMTRESKRKREREREREIECADLPNLTQHGRFYVHFGLHTRVTRLVAIVVVVGSRLVAVGCC